MRPVRVDEDVVRRLVQGERFVEFAEGEETGVRGDAGAVEFELEAAIENDSEIGFSVFTRRVRIPPPPRPPSSP